MMRLLAVVLFATVSCASMADAAEWVDGSGSHCDAVCGERGPLRTDNYRSGLGDPFMVCAANVNNEGYRPGYNRTENPACVVGYAGREHFATAYKCLCGRNPPTAR